MSIKKNELSSDGLRMLRNGLCGSLAIAALVLSSSAFAAENLGMRVVRDATTGELRAPTADEFKALQAQEALSRTSAKSQPVGMLTKSTAPQMQHMKNGGTKLELLDDTMVYSVVQRAADGSLNMQCVTGADAANKSVNSKDISVTPQAKEHKHDVQ
jgi:hypothetical protein